MNAETGLTCYGAGASTIAAGRKNGRRMNGIEKKSARFRSVGPIWAMSIALLAPLALAACHSDLEKADGLEGLYDKEMSVKAYPAALKTISLAVRLDDNEPRRWLKLAKVQDLVNNSSAAAISYQRALDLEPTNIEALENLAILSVRAGQFGLAKEYIDPLLLLQPNDLAGLLASGAVAMNEKRFADAEKVANTIITQAPALAEGYILRARIIELSGRPRDAIALLEERQKADPANNDLPRELMGMYRRQGDRTGIRRMSITLHAKFPGDTKYALEAARAYHGAGRDDEARALLAELSGKHTGNVSVMNAVAGLWRDIEARPAAVDQIAALAARTPPHVRATLADMLTAMGEPARAATLLSFIADQPVTVGNIDIQGSYARALYALGRVGEVQTKVDDLIAFDRDNPGGLLLRARIELARGDFMKAATDAAIVATGDDTNEEAALLLTQIYAKQGNDVLAAKAFGEARGNFPNSPGILDVQTKWLLSRQRAKEATAMAAAYAHAHGRQYDGWRIYRDVCTAAQNPACAAEARQAIANLS
jgi:predicted Zn-dependent protease